MIIHKNFDDFRVFLCVAWSDCFSCLVCCIEPLSRRIQPQELNPIPAGEYQNNRLDLCPLVCRNRLDQSRLCCGDAFVGVLTESINVSYRWMACTHGTMMVLVPTPMFLTRMSFRLKKAMSLFLFLALWTSSGQFLPGTPLTPPGKGQKKNWVTHTTTTTTTTTHTPHHSLSTTLQALRRVMSTFNSKPTAQSSQKKHGDSIFKSTNHRWWGRKIYFDFGWWDRCVHVSGVYVRVCVCVCVCVVEWWWWWCSYEMKIRIAKFSKTHWMDFNTNWTYKRNFCGNRKFGEKNTKRFEMQMAAHKKDTKFGGKSFYPKIRNDLVAPPPLPHPHHHHPPPTHTPTHPAAYSFSDVRFCFSFCCCCCQWRFYHTRWLEDWSSQLWSGLFSNRLLNDFWRGRFCGPRFVYHLERVACPGFRDLGSFFFEKNRSVETGDPGEKISERRSHIMVIISPNMHGNKLSLERFSSGRGRGVGEIKWKKIEEKIEKLLKRQKTITRERVV